VACAQETSWKSSADVSLHSHYDILSYHSIFAPVTNIPLDTRQDGPPNQASRPPWIRPVRKKAPSVARSNASGDSPSHHSSPEAFSPTDFFSDPKVPGFSSGPPSNASGSSNHAVSNQASNPYAHSAGAPTPQTNNPNGPNFSLDPSSGMGMDMIREDAQMYMSPNDMMAFFGDSSVDVNHLFSADAFLQNQTPTLHHHPPPGSVGVGMSPPGQQGVH